MINSLITTIIIIWYRKIVHLCADGRLIKLPNPGGCAIYDISQKRMLNTNPTKYSLSITYFVITHSFRNFAESSAVCKIKKGWTIETDVMDEGYFARVGFQMKLGRISYCTDPLKHNMYYIYIYIYIYIHWPGSKIQRRLFEYELEYITPIWQQL